MTKRRRLKTDDSARDALLVAAFLGADAAELRALEPVMFRLPGGREVDLANPFLNLPDLIQFRRACGAEEAAILELLRAEWPRLRPRVLTEWRRRGRRGPPPGAWIMGRTSA